MNSPHQPHVPGDAPDSQAMAVQQNHWGRPRSWICVAVMIIGFIVAGFGLTQDSPWPWVIGGGAAFVIGGIAALLLGITRDVVVDDLQVNRAYRKGPPAPPSEEDSVEER